MLVSLDSRKTVMARLRSLAMTPGPLPVRTRERSSSQPLSRTRCRRSSINQWRGWLPLTVIR